MADLGNSKIKDTYTLVLQTDSSGNLQKLDGTTPSPFIVNGNLRYVDGNQALNYVLTSDASGNASWSEAGGTSYWSANTDGSISPSGLSTTVQTEGDVRVSGTVYTTKIQTTGSTSADTLTIEAGEISLRNRDGVTEYLKVGPQGFTFLLNDTEAVTFMDDANKYYFDGRPGSEPDWYTFNFAGDNGYMVLEMNAEWELARFKEHMAIGATYGTWPNTKAIQYGLYVAGSSQFQSGGTYVSTNAIEAVGDISGTTDLYIDANMYSGTTNLLDIFASSAITNQDVYWSANTDGTISNSGFTNVGIGTKDPNKPLTVVGDISGTTDLYIGDNIRGLRGQFGNLPTAAGSNRDVEIKGDGSVYLRLQSTTNASQFIEFLNDQEPDFLIYNKHSDGGLHIASDDKSFLIIGANDGDAIDLYGNTTISGNTTLSGNTSYSGTISGTGSVTAIGGFVGDVTGDLTGNADTVTNGVYTTNNLSVMASTTSAQLRGVLSDETGTGSAVFATSPTLVTPALGTPTSGVLTNATGYPGDSSFVTAGIVTTGTWASNRKFELSEPDVGNGEGDIVYFGDSVATNPGGIYYYDTNGSWALTSASAVGTATGLLVVALGDLSNENGMLIKGMVTLSSDPGGISLPIYLSETDGKATTTAPDTSGAVVRALGYVMADGSGQIYFDPDKTWVELS